MRAARKARRVLDTDGGSPLSEPSPPASLQGVLLHDGKGPFVVFSYTPNPPGEMADAPFALSPAQTEVAQMIVAGFSTAQIALARATRPATVRKQIEAIFQKLGVGSRAELARRWQPETRDEDKT